MEAIKDYKRTKDEDALYRAVLDTDMKMSECEEVLKDTMKEKYSKRKLCKMINDEMVEEMNKLSVIEAVSSAFEEC